MPIDIPTDLLDVSKYEGLVVELRYADSDNFLGMPVYGDFKQCLLRRIAAEKLAVALGALKKQRPGWKLVAFDCWRPQDAQEKMWAQVVGTPKQKYVADPKRGSLHNFGLAVDAGLRDTQGKMLDMGTSFDHFGPESHVTDEALLLKKGLLTQTHIDNRHILRDIMQGAGFLQLPHEWWHYDALPKASARALFH